MHSTKRRPLVARPTRGDASSLYARKLHARKFLGRLAAAASLLVLVSAPFDAHAQVRGLNVGGAVGGAVGTVVGTAGSGVGSAVGATSGLGSPGVSGPGNLGLPGAAPQPSGVPNWIGTGVSIPIGTGNPLSLPRPDLGTVPNPGPITNTVTNTINGTGANTLSIPGRRTNGTGSTVNRAGRNAATSPPRRSGVPPVGERRFVPDEVVVGLPASLSPQMLDALGRRHGLSRLESQRVGLTGTTFHRWRITDRRSVSDVIRALEADAGVRSAQPNYRFALAQQQSRVAGAATTIPEAMQYAPEKLHLPQAHRLATGNKVLIAVIDSGIDTSHPEIAGFVAASFDALNSHEPPHGHGTAMAGAIIAHAALKGVAPSARILAIRAFGASRTGAEGTTLTILKAVDWAVAHGARVINMSFTGPTDPEVARGLAAAHKKGVVLVAAAGNAGPKSPPLFPASDGNVIAVTATDSEDKLPATANRGKHIAVAAPGVDILAAAPGASYQMTSGTSIAAAHVSGIAALLIELKPNLTPEDVRKILLATATDLGPKGRDDQFGAGLANAHRAVLSLTANTARASPESVSAAR
jgi:subtilisin family serine protease